MKQISNVAAVGIAIGLGVIVMSGLRYFVLFPDMDKALMYSLTGFLLIMVSWFYNKILNLSNTLYDVEVYLAEGGK